MSKPVTPLRAMLCPKHSGRVGRGLTVGGRVDDQELLPFQRRHPGCHPGHLHTRGERTELAPAAGSGGAPWSPDRGGGGPTCCGTHSTSRSLPFPCLGAPQEEGRAERRESDKGSPPPAGGPGHPSTRCHREVTPWPEVPGSKGVSAWKRQPCLQQGSRLCGAR